jgi:acyl carrier protein
VAGGVESGAPPAERRVPTTRTSRRSERSPGQRAFVAAPHESRELKQKEWIVDLEQKVIEIVSEKLSVPKEEITLESNFIDDLKADSLDLVEMVMAFEDSLGVSIPDEDQEKIRTVGDAVNYIRQKENA